MKSKYLSLALAAALAFTATIGNAQNAGNGNAADNPDWTEDPVAPPPTFSVDRLIPIDMPAYVSLKVGVDPETIVVGGDGVVRYVIVMRNAAGNANAVYEGIRCTTGEVKTYARLSVAGTWSVLGNPAWKDLNDNMPSHHAQAFATQGGCQGRSATSKQEIIDMLKAGLNTSPYKKAY